MGTVNYRLDVYYQKNDGMPHEKIEAEKLYRYIGWAMAEDILQTAEERLTYQLTPEAKAFHEYGVKQVICANLTNRGNVYIEAVEVE